VVKEHVAVVVKVGLCFWCFFLFCLVGTLVDSVVCCWMLVGGCLVFVGLFDLFFSLGCGGGYVCSQHRW
jgi:hypothetical protein